MQVVEILAWLPIAIELASLDSTYLDILVEAHLSTRDHGPAMAKYLTGSYLHRLRRGGLVTGIIISTVAASYRLHHTFTRLLLSWPQIQCPVF